MNARALHWTLIAATIFVYGCCSSADWPMFRQNPLRTAEQVKASPLSDPEKVKDLKCMWRFPDPRPETGHPHPSLGGGFIASPVVYKGQVFIGNGNGYFYALDAKTGAKRWQFPKESCSPPETCQPLVSKFPCNRSGFGIASSAVIARIGKIDAVIFAAPDPSTCTGLGEGRLFALNLHTGREIWRSPVIARLTGTRNGCTAEFHENLGHSSPLVLGDKVYVGVSDHCDNPVQKGRVAAVYLTTGSLVDAFHYCSTKITADRKASCDDPADKTRGGGVWSPPAGLKDSVYITTGNTRSGQNFNPPTNHGLSLLRLDAATGEVLWKYQPVPWELDGDPDWSAAPTILSTRCGRMIVSTQKDGWTHALNADDGSLRWSYPPDPAPPFSCTDGTCHGDTAYMRSGATWGNVYVTMNGGLNLTRSVREGYNHLHAFNVCAPDDESRLRWLIEVPDTSNCIEPEETDRCLGNPTITGGIVYIGTNRGHLVAIADPDVDVRPGAGKRCENQQVFNADCINMGYRLVRQPRVVKSVKLIGSMAYTEPALANGKVYVSTEAGFVFMLQPSTKESPCPQ